MAHTPGPWTCDTTTLEVGDSIDDLIIADISRDGFPEQAEANTRLIAAAPELLEALKKAPQYLLAWQHQLRKEMSEAQTEAEKAHVRNGFEQVERELMTINAAIARATGDA